MYILFCRIKRFWIRNRKKKKKICLFQNELGQSSAYHIQIAIYLCGHALPSLFLCPLFLHSDFPDSSVAITSSFPQNYSFNPPPPPISRWQLPLLSNCYPRSAFSTKYQFSSLCAPKPLPRIACKATQVSVSEESPKSGGGGGGQVRIGFPSCRWRRCPRERGGSSFKIGRPYSCSGIRIRFSQLTIGHLLRGLIVKAFSMPSLPRMVA